MFEKFTERARKVMSLSRQEAQRLESDFIGTEHILLGIVKEDGGVAVTALKNLKIDPAVITLEVEKLVTKSTPTVTLGQLPFSPRSKRVIELSGEAASQMGHDVIGTEHLLLGLIKENEGIAAQVLFNMGLKIDEVRDMVLDILGNEKTQDPNSFTHKETNIAGTIIDKNDHSFTVLQRDGSKSEFRLDHLGADRAAVAVGRRIHVKMNILSKFLD